MSSSSGGAANNAEVHTGQQDPRTGAQIALDEARQADDAVARLEAKREKARQHLADADQALKDAKAEQKEAAKRLKDAEKGGE